MNIQKKSADKPSKSAIVEQLERIKRSKLFERSKINCKLLSFLVNYHLNSVENNNDAKAPKEFEIAMGALDKANDFNPAEDASIRVYISNLRKKLETYYQTEGTNEAFQISIPTGAYGLEFNLVSKQETPIKNNKKSIKNNYFLIGAITLSVLLNLVLVASYLLEKRITKPEKSTEISQFKSLKQHALWQPLLSNPKATLIVIGDLYMLTELDPQTQLLRAIREFGVNSDLQFEDYLNKHPEKRTKINKASSAFLLKNSVYALQHILPLFTEESPATIRLASELTASDLRDYNIVYLGLYKSLGLLDSYLEGSNFQIKASPPSLEHNRSGRVYTVTGDLEQEYTDYGTFAQFSGPSGNLFYIFAGFSDASVIQMAKYLTNQTRLSSNEFKQHFESLGNANSNFELIFSASSFNRTDLDSNLVDNGLLDIKSIWAMPK